MKKLLVVLISIMLCALISIPAFAASTEDNLVVWTDMSEVVDADTDVTLKVNSNGTTTDGLLTIVYNKDVLSIEESDVTPVDSKAVAMYGVNIGAGIVKISYISESNVKDGCFFQLKFKRKAEGDTGFGIQGTVNCTDGKTSTAINIIAAEKPSEPGSSESTGDNGSSAPGDNGSSAPGDNGSSAPGDNGSSAPGDNGDTGSDVDIPNTGDNVPFAALSIILFMGVIGCGITFVTMKKKQKGGYNNEA